MSSLTPAELVNQGDNSRDAGYRGDNQNND